MACEVLAARWQVGGDRHAVWLSPVDSFLL